MDDKGGIEKICGLSIGPPLVERRKKSAHVIVIGAGVAGCTTAWFLADQGFYVTVLARELPSFSEDQGTRLTSQIGAALWEFPCPPCGPTVSIQNRARIRKWAVESYRVYSSLAERDLRLTAEGELNSGEDATEQSQDPLSTQGIPYGVNMKRTVNLYPFHCNQYGPERERLQEMQSCPVLKQSIRHDTSGEIVEQMRKVGGATTETTTGRFSTKLMSATGHAIKEAVEYEAPVIDTDQAMRFLVTMLRQDKDVAFAEEELPNDIYTYQTELLERFGASAIVNATGNDARDFSGDPDLCPARGALLRYVNDGSKAPKINDAIVINSVWVGDHDITYIVPRNTETLIVGTFFEEQVPKENRLNNDENLDQVSQGESDSPGEEQLSVHSDSVVRMRQRAEKSFPVLKHLELDPKYPLAQAWRPNRVGDVRVERRGCIVHNYGHGVYGWSTAFGCAAEAARLVSEIVTEKKQKEKGREQREVPRPKL